MRSTARELVLLWVVMLALIKFRGASIHRNDQKLPVWESKGTETCWLDGYNARWL
jgi:hypothetical protein